MKNLALFDFDGTITTREMLPDFFRLAIPRRRQRIGQILIAPLIIGYKLGIVSGSMVRAAIVRLGFSGVPYDHGDTAEDKELLALGSRKFYQGREVHRA